MIFHHPAPGRRREKCSMCDQQSTHKVGEEFTGLRPTARHNFTNYLCCEHFGQVMGGLAVRWCGGDWP